MPDAGSTAQASGAERFLQEASSFYVCLDDDGVVVAWNRAAEALFGWTAEQALGQPLDALIVPPSSHAAHRAGLEAFRRTGRGRGLQGPVEVEALRADGTTVPVELSIWAERTASGHAFHALGHDLTARRRDQHVLEVLAAHRQGLLLTERPEDARRLLCDTVRDAAGCQGVYLYEPGPRGVHEPLRLTAQALHLGSAGTPDVRVDGLLADHLARSPAGFRLRRDDLGSSAAADALRSTGLGSFVCKPLHRQGSLVGVLVLGWHSVARAADSGHEQLVDLLVSEALLVFERLAVQDELRRAARTDPLTGLANRRAFDERLQAEVDAAGERALSLAVLDLDRFKRYNDAHGHPAGDRLLQRVTQAWQAALDGRGGLDGQGWLARLGGDEFALLLPGADATAAGEVLAAVVAATPPEVGVTHGLAVLAGGEDGEALLQRADALLYAGKRSR